MVILYADRITEAMQEAISTTLRRRKVQLDYNEQNGITPKTIVKAIRSALADQLHRKVAMEAISATEQEYDRTELITKLEAQMLEAAEALEFEQAARLRNRIKELKLEEETQGLAQTRRRREKSSMGILPMSITGVPPVFPSGAMLPSAEACPVVVLRLTEKTCFRKRQRRGSMALVSRLYETGRWPDAIRDELLKLGVNL